MPRPLKHSFLFAATLMLQVAAFADTPNFNRDVRPILSETCFHCHGPDAQTRQADLRLDEKESTFSVVEPGDDNASELVRRITSNDPDQQMPPPGCGKELSDSQRKILVDWVRGGADYQDHWAFRSASRVTPPTDESGWSAAAIDQFVAAEMKQHGLRPSKPASRATLARRVTIDLTGLPPTLDEVDRFVNDEQPKALERLIDSLMQSPRYGEHMALPWLEASRYADTDGYQNDRYRYQHVWRDWVIAAFNQNMPYNDFIIQQLAGDMLPNATLNQQIATGFGRNHRINSEDGSIPEEWRVANVVDRVDTFGTAFLGMTIECARCHDHKYDPISQKDYYRLFAYFNNIAEWGVGPNNGNSPPFIEIPASWPDLSPGEDQLIAPDPVKLKRARETEGNGLKRPQPGSPKTLMVMHELEEPRETYVLLRGQYNAPDKSERLTPGVPDSLNLSQHPNLPNRLGLANWLVDPANPLTARVAVNRIWQQFFGSGIVESSENFGSQGTPPSHLELLDWLAIELIENDWDLRHIQKQILLSKTYQQSSAITPRKLEADPKNRWLSRGPRVRMPGFVLRDQALAVSGLLVEKIGGPSTKPYMPPKIWKAISNNAYKQDTGANLYRRSLYTYWRRTIPPPTMMTFNAAAREVCTVRTERTNTPLQALALMNNTIFVESARMLAARMIEEAGPEIGARIELGFRLVCARKPNTKEATILHQTYEEFLKQFSEDRTKANELLGVGQSTLPTKTPTQHAALTMVASLILNLDEAITKE